MITVNWLDKNQRILLIRMNGPYTNEDLFASFDSVQAELDRVEHHVHFIIDQRHAQAPRGALASLRQVVRESPTVNHPRAGTMIMVTRRNVMRLINEMTVKLFPSLNQRAIFVDTLNDALAAADALIRER